MHATQDQIDSLLESVESAMLAFDLDAMRGKHAEHWNALRISPDGEIAGVREVSRSLPESEYFATQSRRNGIAHPLTFHESTGRNFSPDPTTGWEWKESAEGEYVGSEKTGEWKPFDADESIPAGWIRFDLNLSSWCVDDPEADEQALEAVREWAEAGNYRPESE